MSSQNHLNFKVLLTGAPEKCSLKDIKTEIQKAIESTTAVDRVQRCKTSEGNFIPGRLEIILASNEDLQNLLKLAVIEYESDDALYIMKVTRCRPQLSIPSSTTTSVSTVSETKRNTSREKLRLSYESSSESNDDSSDDDHGDRSDEDNGFQTNRDSSTVQKKLFQNEDLFLDKSENSSIKIPSNSTTWFDILQSKPEIFENYSDNCVLVQSESDETIIKEVNQVFKNPKFGQHLIKEVLCLKDGFLLIYNDKNVARNLLKEEDWFSNELSLKVFEKPIPPIYQDRILLKGDFEKKSTSDVRDIMDCCINAAFKVKKMKERDFVLVVFENPINFDELKKGLKKLPRITSKPLVLKICRSDCIKVQNIKETVADDLLRISFMNKKYSNGTVTMIDRSEDNRKTAFVYFTDYKDAESLVEKSKQSEILVNKSPVNVSLFCTGINDSVEFSSDNIYQFQIELEVDKDVGKFVTTSSGQLRNLHKEMGDLANVGIVLDPVTEQYSAKVKPINQKDEEIDQESFEEECHTRIMRYFKKFKESEKFLNLEDQDRVRNLNEWTDEEDLVELKIKHTDVCILVRWSDSEKQAIKVVGLPKHVELFLSWFEEKCNYTEESVQFSPGDFEVLTHCGIYQNMLDFFGESVSIELNFENLTLVFRGQKETVKSSIMVTKNATKQIVDCDLSFLHISQQEFLRKLMKEDSGDDTAIVEFLQERLQDQQIKVAVQKQKNRVVLKYDSKNRHDLNQAQEEIRSMLKLKNIPIDNNYDEMMEEKEWKHIQNEIEASGRLCVFEDKLSSSITLVGLPSAFNQHYERISSFLDENVETESTVNLTYAKALFFSTFSEESGIDKNLDRVEWHKKPPGIHIKGRSCLVQKASNWIQNTAKTLITQSRQLSIPGMASYLNDSSGKQFLKSVSKQTSCIVLLDSEEPSEWVATKNKTNFHHQGNENREIIRERIPEVKPKRGLFEKAKNFIFGDWDVSLTPEQKSSVRTSVVHGDILTSDCSVMINTVGTDFDLTLSKVSSALIKQAGGDMIEECKDYPLEKTEILRVTGAPNLSFKNIIHLVTPENPEKICKYLLEVFKLVETKFQHRSLAVPAIGTGKIGMTDVAVAKSIRKAIDLFRKTNPTHLKKIDVVVYEKTMIPAFKKAFSDSSSLSQSPPSSPPPKPVPTPRVFHSANVFVKTGDILASACDVLVNTVGSNFNLSTSQLSAKVLQNAGQVIQNECLTNPVLKSSAFRITSGGSSNFQNIVHFVTPKNGVILANNLFQTLKVVDQTLKKKSIAIPAIGTGNAGLQITDVANAFGTAINNFVATNPKYLRTIEVVIFQAQMVSLFQNSINTSISSGTLNTASSGDGSKAKPKQSFVFRSENKEEHYLVLYLTSNNRNNIDQAFEKIQAQAKQKCSSRVLQNDVLEILESDDHDELQNLATKYNVCVKTSDDKKVKNQLEIYGRRKDVTEAYAAVVKMLSTYELAVTCADYVMWKYEDPKTSVWINHSLKANYDLECGFKENQNGQCKTKMNINGSKEDLTIFFSKMEQKCGRHKSLAKVGRFELAGNTEFPSNWEGSKSRQLVDLNQPKYSAEYQTVVNQFQSTFNSGQNIPRTRVSRNPGMRVINNQGGNINIIRVERVENKRLFKQFSAQKNEVQERIKNGTTQGPATKELFHGTSSDVCVKICKDGFNRSYAGRNATAFGKGVYFATTSEYSHRYTHPNPNGERQMFLAEVITGEYAQGDPAMIDPPQKPGTTDLYDSVVNNVSSPSIFVVFKDASVYPLYLITYM